MALQRGEKAPSFSLYSDGMDAVNLDDYRGENVLLLFYPGAFISTYAKELTTVNNELETYEDLGTSILAISTDSPFVLQEFKEVHMFDFPLLSDHDAVVSAEYGVKCEHDFTDMRFDRISRCAAFVLDEEGVVQYIRVLKREGEIPDFDQIVDVLENLS